MWCKLENRIVTWDYLQKRTFAGPGWCSLCKDNGENPNHLFLTCIFSKQVWKHSQTLSTYQFLLGRPHAGGCLEILVYNPLKYMVMRALPLLHIWGIWIARNKSIFHEKASIPEEVTKKGLEILSYFPQTKDSSAPRIILEEQRDKDMPWDFFDDASQD